MANTENLAAKADPALKRRVTVFRKQYGMSESEFLRRAALFVMRRFSTNPQESLVEFMAANGNGSEA